MVTQTRGMARSAARSAFINFQSQRHQTRSVVRATNLFKSLPEDTKPPPIPQPRIRKRRALEPEPEEGRPAKRNRRAARAAAPVRVASPSPPPANFSPPPSPHHYQAPPSPSPPLVNLPPPPTPSPYIPAPVPSPTSIFPLRKGQSFRPPATPAEASQAGAILSLWRGDLHGTVAGSIYHEPGYEGPAKKKTPKNWQLKIPNNQVADDYREETEYERMMSRYEDIKFNIRNSPNEWLDRRMCREENPSNGIQEARRQQMAIDKRDFIADGHNLNEPDPSRYQPWNGSTLSEELGWKWVGDSLYMNTRPA
ncbi:hypothetical protein BKA65DRAFT_547685 [Rhexocercosporidium sp. MPI-PUGE-AT-0058]|nr:hypothetical protein BKA65DRAFT_547685 [Rhexocercosporidium sp. MPI-PUGE-AT-0058]